MNSPRVLVLPRLDDESILELVTELSEVVPNDDRLLRQAILRELNRQGQVFFVHNRVETIEEAARFLVRLYRQQAGCCHRASIVSPCTWRGLHEPTGHQR